MYGYVKLITYFSVTISEVLEYKPSSISFTLSCKKMTQWLDGMNEEIKSLHLNNTRALVHKLGGSRLVSYKCIFKQKYDNPETSQQRLKARLVARVFIERE